MAEYATPAAMPKRDLLAFGGSHRAALAKRMPAA
jgi:hypothetical protein